jgi:acetyl esterase/lipase
VRGSRIEAVAGDGVRGEAVTAPGAESGAHILYFSGGAYLFASSRARRGFASRLSRAARSRVFTVDYRVAPEDPFPAAVYDGVAAYGLLRAQGAAPGEVVIGGDSAGGGLAAAVLVALRDAGEPLPAAAFLLSPWLDLALTGASLASLAAGDEVLDEAGLRAAAGLYLAGVDPREPLASPLYADLRGLPEILVQAGGAEMLLDDSVRFATAARAAGVRVILDVWPGAGHGFQTMAPLTLEARRAVHQIGLFVVQVTDG